MCAGGGLARHSCLLRPHPLIRQRSPFPAAAIPRGAAGAAAPSGSTQAAPPHIYTLRCLYRLRGRAAAADDLVNRPAPVDLLLRPTPARLAVAVACAPHELAGVEPRWGCWIQGRDSTRPQLGARRGGHARAPPVAGQAQNSCSSPSKASPPGPRRPGSLETLSPPSPAPHSSQSPRRPAATRRHPAPPNPERPRPREPRG